MLSEDPVKLGELDQQKRLCLSCATRITSGQAFEEIKTARGPRGTKYRHSSYQDCQEALSDSNVKFHYAARN